MSRLTRLGSWLLLWAARGVAFLPRPLMLGLAHAVGELMVRFAGHRRRVATRNLEICFPEKTDQERRVMVKAHFQCYARAFFERFEIWFGRPERLRARVKIQRLNLFEELRGQPIIILAPHFLGLDAGGVRFQLEHQFASMYAKQSNPVLDAWTLQGRTRFNSPVIVSRQQGLAGLARLLKRGVPLYFLPDMDLGRRHSIFVPFFGEPAATVTSLVRLAQMLDAVVLPLVTRMTDDGYEATFYPGWKHREGDETPEEAVAVMHRFIEARIREMPEQYLWTHRRFKTRPPGYPKVYA
jgi:Kdo2-lipid IVA lauroyltransferase/acyltransferase